MIDQLTQYKMIKEAFETNKHRSIISSNLSNKNFLVIGEDIEQIALVNKILTPETLEVYLNTLLEEIVYIGSSGESDFSQIKYINEKFVPDMTINLSKYQKSSLDSIFSELNCIFLGRYYDIKFPSDIDLRKNGDYRDKYTNFFYMIMIRHNQNENIHYKNFLSVLKSNPIELKNNFVKLKDFLPGLLLINKILDEEILSWGDDTSSKEKDFIKYIKSIVFHHSIYFSLRLNSELKKLLEIQNIDNKIFFNINNLNFNLKENDYYPIEGMIKNYIMFDESNELNNISKKENLLNDISINILNSNNPIKVIEEKIDSYINSNNTEVKNIIIFDKYSFKYQNILNKYSNDKVNFIFDGEQINYTYLSSENVLLHSLKNKVNLNKGIKSSTVYTSKQTINNNDTLNINNIFLFNIAKNLFYSKSLKKTFNSDFILNLDQKHHWLFENKTIDKEIKNQKENKFLDKIEQIKYNRIERIKKDIKLVEEFKPINHNKINTDIKKNILLEEKIPMLEETRKKVFESAKIDLNLIGLKIDNKNDVLSLANISDNYKYMQLMFKTIEGDFNQIIDYDLSWYLNNSEDSKTKKDFLNIVLKEYRDDIKFLLTARGKEYNTQVGYFNLKYSYDSSIRILKSSLRTEIKNFISYVHNANSIINNNECSNYAYQKTDSYNFVDNNELDFLTEETFSLIFKELITKFNVKDNKILYFMDGENDKYTLEELFKKSVYTVIEKNMDNLVKTKEVFNNNEFSRNYFKNNNYNEKILKHLKSNDLLVSHNIEEIFYTFTDKKPIEMKNLLKIKKFIEVLSDWFEVNYNLDRFTPIKEIIRDIERVNNGENYMGVKEEVFIELQETRKRILSDTDFLKMKESYGFYLFDKQVEVFKLKNGCSREDLDTNKDCIIPADKEKLFAEITGIGKYYSDNLSLNENEQKILNSLEGGYFDYFKENELGKTEYSNFLKQFNFDEELLKKEFLEKDKNNLLYYYYHLYKNVNVKINDGVLDINKSSKILNEIPLLFFKKFKQNVSFEKTYYSEKGKIASIIDDKYLIFKKSDQKVIQNFLNEVKYSKFLNIDYKEKLYKSTAYLLKVLNENIGDLVLENVFNRHKRTTLDENFYLYQILRIYINNARGILQDNLITSLYNASCINEKMNADIFFKKTNVVLTNVSPLIYEINSLKNNYKLEKKDEKIPYEQLETINNKLKTIINVMESEFNDFGQLNYEKIQKELNDNLTESGMDKEKTLYGSFEKLFEMQFLETAKLDNMKEFHSFFISIPGYINPVVENIMKNLVEKYKVAILVFSPNKDNNLDLKKIYTIFDNNFTSEKKYKFNVANIVYTNKQVLNYDKDLLDIDFPDSYKPAVVKQFNF